MTYSVPFGPLYSQRRNPCHLGCCSRRRGSISNEVVCHGTAAIKGEGRLETADCFLMVETKRVCNAMVDPQLASVEEVAIVTFLPTSPKSR